VYKSFSTPDKVYYKDDIIDDPQAQEWLELFPSWFEKVDGDKEPEKAEETPVEEVVVEEPIVEESEEVVVKKVPKVRKL
jgi:hypothetical protein